MKAIYKYPLEIRNCSEIEMPQDAVILSAQVQGSTICIWALVDPEAAPQSRVFSVYGTGHPIETPGLFLSTVQIGSLVFHIFEKERQ